MFTPMSVSKNKTALSATLSRGRNGCPAARCWWPQRGGRSGALLVEAPQPDAYVLAARRFGCAVKCAGGSTPVPTAAGSWKAFRISLAPRRAVCFSPNVNYWPPHRRSSSKCTSRVGIQRRWRVDRLLDAVSLTVPCAPQPYLPPPCPVKTQCSQDRPPGSAAARIPAPASRLRCARATSRPSRCRICLGGPAQGDEEHTLAYPLLMVNARVEAKKKQQGETLE